MKSLHLHAVFAVLSVAASVFLVSSLVQRHAAVAVNRVIANPRRAAAGAEPPLAALARGVALAHDGDRSGAQRAYQRVLQDGPPGLQRLAHYDLGNLHLREAIKRGPVDTQTLPLIELAKQQYREVLAEQPNDWDARYNLERALWLAPEFEAAADRAITAPRPRGRTTMKNVAGDLP